MPSTPSIAAQAVPCLLVAFPGWSKPMLCNVRATIGGGAGVATVQSTEGANGEAPTTPGWSIARDAAGIYNVTFPSVRRWAPSTFHAMTRTTVAGTLGTTDLRPAVIDRSATNTNPRGIAATPQIGRIRVGFYTNAGAVPAELPDNLEINLSVWVDAG